jgi:hypothetical protein
MWNASRDPENENGNQRSKFSHLLAIFRMI